MQTNPMSSAGLMDSAQIQLQANLYQIQHDDRRKRQIMTSINGWSNTRTLMPNRDLFPTVPKNILIITTLHKCKDGRHRKMAPNWNIRFINNRLIRTQDLLHPKVICVLIYNVCKRGKLHMYSKMASTSKYSCTMPNKMGGEHYLN